MFTRIKQAGSSTAAGLGGLLIIALWLAAIVGYVMNAFKLVNLAFNVPHPGTGELIVRIVGVFTGIIGAIAGYF